MRIRMRFIACLLPALCASGCLDEAGTGPSGEDIGFRNKVWTTPPGDYAPIAVGYHWTYREVDSTGKTDYTTHSDSMSKWADRQVEYEVLSSQADPATGDSLYLVRERTRDFGSDGKLGAPADRSDTVRVKGDRPVESFQVILSSAFAIPFLYQYRYLDTSGTNPESLAKNLKTALLGNDTLRAYHDSSQGSGFGGSVAWFYFPIYVENVGLFEESKLNANRAYGATDEIYLVSSIHVRLLEFNGRSYDHSQLRE